MGTRGPDGPATLCLRRAGTELSAHGWGPGAGWALDRADAVIVTGGLGPTQDDVTREALAAVAGVSLVRQPDLEQWLCKVTVPSTGLYKCRIVYDQLSKEVSFTPYSPKRIRRVRVVEDNSIDYAHKFTDRTSIDQLFLQRGDCDDVLIVKNGKVTDCSFSNIVFRKGDQWVTPDTPLLEGTMRQRLLDENLIRSREIRGDDIRSFDTFRIINAMLEFESPEIEVSAIVF